MTITVYVPCDATAVSLGADQIAEDFAQLSSDTGHDIRLVRNGTRGLFWLEPMIEIDSGDGKRIAYGPVSTTHDVESLIKTGVLDGHKEHALALGPVDEIPALAAQTRLTFSRIGVTDPRSLEDYQAHGGFEGLENALTAVGQPIVDAVKESGLRGRGGAAFPTGIKWQTVHDAQSDQKYIVCNADEGDSGTFADRLVMECDPYMLIEGMTIAALAVGATEGYVYLRSEYPIAADIFQSAIDSAVKAGWLGGDIRGSGQTFNLHLRIGAEAYICGEETSLLESLEGKRGLVRAKPPLPALVGLFGQPTIVNNVLTFAAVPEILAKGAAEYHKHGAGRSRGTLPVQLAGNIRNGGLFEVPFGTALREIIETHGGGTASGHPVRAVQVGGPLGAYLPQDQLDLPLDYEQFAEAKAVLGHGGVVVFDDTVDMLEQARFSMEFCAVESCGKCTPCRIGSQRGVEVIDRIRNNENRAMNMELLSDLCDTMVDGSLCAMGGMTPFPVRSAFTHFPDDFNK